MEFELTKSNKHVRKRNNKQHMASIKIKMPEGKSHNNKIVYTSMGRETSCF